MDLVNRAVELQMDPEDMIRDTFNVCMPAFRVMSKFKLYDVQINFDFALLNHLILIAELMIKANRKITFRINC